MRGERDPGAEAQALVAAPHDRGRAPRAADRDSALGVRRAGVEGTTVEEIAARAQVSKPIVYEHFGGKEGLYAVVVDREVLRLLDMMRQALTAGTRGSCSSRRPSRCSTTSTPTPTASASSCATPRWARPRART
jgi:AcrR family transcriptional regulator